MLKKLNIREYECPNCNYELDRDYNASENIMFEGLKLYMNEVSAHAKLQKIILNKLNTVATTGVKDSWTCRLRRL